MEVEIMSGGSDKKEGKYPGFDNYEVEHAADLLLRAQEIKDDPKLMEAVKICLADKQKAISSISDLKAARQKANNYKGAIPDKKEPEKVEAQEEAVEGE